MLRRSLLQALAGACLVILSLGNRPAEAKALGGVLPPVDAVAPDFQLSGLSEGSERLFRLADFRGRWLVLYFYPKDFTGGCTLEARGFQKDLARFHQAGADVVGVSADEVADHASFCDSEGLTFPLLSDQGGEVSKRYGSWMPPFSQRHTFLIDPAGILRSRWTAVRPTGHSEEVLAELHRMQSSLS